MFPQENAVWNFCFEFSLMEVVQSNSTVTSSEYDYVRSEPNVKTRKKIRETVDLLSTLLEDLENEHNLALEILHAENKTLLEVTLDNTEDGVADEEKLKLQLRVRQSERIFFKEKLHFLRFVFCLFFGFLGWKKKTKSASLVVEDVGVFPGKWI